MSIRWICPAPISGARGGGQPLEPYVNDRPYAASSFLSVAISQVFGSALGGRCKEKPDLPAQILPLTVRISALPCRAGGAELPERLFGAAGLRRRRRAASRWTRRFPNGATAPITQ